MIRVDSHFHPNFSFLLPKALIRRRARRIWKKFEQCNLDAVFISEHSYKQPARSYLTLLANKPTHAKTALIPAVEALSSEGMELIVFSKDTSVFSEADILRPYALPIRRLIDLVCNDPRLYAILPHPFTLSDTGFIHHLDESKLREAAHRIHFMEKYNASLRPLQKLLHTLGLSRVLRRIETRIEETAIVPQALCGKGIISLGGSDAHHIREIGTHLVIHAKTPATYDELFRTIISDAHSRSIAWHKSHMPSFLDVLLDSFSVLSERLKKVLGLYHLDRTFLPN